MALLLQESVGLREVAPQQKDERNDEAAKEEGHAPTPLRELIGRKPGAQRYAEEGHNHHRHLLAAGLPAHIKAFVAWRRDFGEIDGDAAELDARGEALNEAPQDDEQRREPAPALIARHQRDEENANRHQAKR